jgi:hypothetical protein
MIEGTRNERAALVLASYVVGFITAFIMYSNISSTEESAITYVSTPAAVITATPVEKTAEVVSSNVKLEYKEGKLEVTVAGLTNLLSFNTVTAGIDVDVTDMSQGYHFGELNYALSPDEKFVFFCEKPGVDESNCLGYVYDINADRIFPVTKEGVQVSITPSSAASAKWTAGGLNIGSTRSANPAAPWVLIN